jgi:hypothetical protein
MTPQETSAGPPDAQVNAMVAERVAGWKPHAHPLMKYMDGSPVMITTPSDYLNDANAVIALLEKEGMVEIQRMHREKIGWQWEVKVWKADSRSFFEDEGHGPTFCAAACLALLAAHADKGKG